MLQRVGGGDDERLARPRGRPLTLACLAMPQVWGPHGSVMNDIAEASYDPESYRQIMSVIGRRLKEEVRREPVGSGSWWACSAIASHWLLGVLVPFDSHYYVVECVQLDRPLHVALRDRKPVLPRPLLIRERTGGCATKRCCSWSF